MQLYTSKHENLDNISFLEYINFEKKKILFKYKKVLLVIYSHSKIKQNLTYSQRFI